MTSSAFGQFIIRKLVFKAFFSFYDLVFLPTSCERLAGSYDSFLTMAVLNFASVWLVTGGGSGHLLSTPVYSFDYALIMAVSNLYSLMSMTAALSMKQAV